MWSSSARHVEPLVHDRLGFELRGIEIEADVMLEGHLAWTAYTRPTPKRPCGRQIRRNKLEEVPRPPLKVMDLTAFTLCRENGTQIIVFDMDTLATSARCLPGEDRDTCKK